MDKRPRDSSPWLKPEGSSLETAETSFTIDRGTRRYTYPDGTLELTSSGAVTGPDQVGGQHFGTCYHYARINGGPWARTTTRSMHAMWTLAGAAESAVEAFEAITEE